MTLAEVQLWGRTIGAVSLEDESQFAAFEYDPAFTRSGIEVSPITMPLSDRVYVFSDLPQKTFHGLPGLLADSLPDRFGNALIDAWLATQGRTPDSFNAVERLFELRADCGFQNFQVYVPALRFFETLSQRLEINLRQIH
jgi:serine/threonine-protein kinase HipA